MRVAIVTASLGAVVLLGAWVLSGAWAAEAAALIPPKCSALNTQRHATLRTGGYERYCGPGRAVVRVGSRSFTIESGNCSGNLNRRSFGLMGYGGLPGRGFWLRLAQTNGRWYVRPGPNTIMDGEVQLPGFDSLPGNQGTAVISKDLKSATFSLGSPPRITGSWKCR